MKSLEILRSEPGRRLLADILQRDGAEAGSPRFVSALRRDWQAEVLNLGLSIAEARRRAPGKYPRGDELWFTPDLLEQASSHPCALHRARRLAPLGPVLDLGCGAGGDLTRLALAGAEVCGLERDELAAELARANLAELALQGEVYGGVFPETPLPKHRVLFADPSRRAAGRPPGGSGRRGRHANPDRFSPAPSVLRPQLDRCRAWAIKWGPALDLGHRALTAADGVLAGMARGDYELECVSWRGELREAILWGGEALHGESNRATVLVGTVAEARAHEFVGDPFAPAPAPRPAKEFILEPDPALIRSGLLADFARRHDLNLLAPEIAYLSAKNPGPRPFCRSWPLLDEFEFSLRRLQAALDDQHAGSLVIKKRGFPESPESLHRRLDLRGDRPITALIYRIEGGHRACLCGPEL